MIPSATNQRQSASNIIANRTGQVNGQVHTNGYDCDVSLYVTLFVIYLGESARASVCVSLSVCVCGGGWWGGGGGGYLCMWLSVWVCACLCVGVCLSVCVGVSACMCACVCV